MTNKEQILEEFMEEYASFVERFGQPPFPVMKDKVCMLIDTYAKQQVEEFQQSLKQKIEEMGGDFPYMPEEVRICSSKERGRYCNTCNRSWSECVCKERSMGYRKCKRDILDLFSPD